MWLSYFTLLVALSLSAIAAWYSIIGLTAIFSAAVIPIMIMGGILEVAKITVTVWLHEYWKRCRLVMKLYLVPAVVALMFITSMGIFGFLSKAHTDQNLVSGDALSRIAMYDDKIKTAKENIDANRKALKQMDEAVDQVMARSSDERGAEKSVAIRRSQQKERGRLTAEIETQQKLIIQLNEQRVPIATEVRKVEAEVGPIKYIAAMLYGDNPDQNLLERAVRWMIIVLVVVFDPLAITMVIAASESLTWHRQDRSGMMPVAVTEDSVSTTVPDNTVSATTDTQPLQAQDVTEADSLDQNVVTQPAYLDNGSKMFFQNLKPTVAIVPHSESESDFTTADRVNSNELDLEVDAETSDEVRAAMRQWKIDNPNDTLKNQRNLLARGEIDKLPWMPETEPKMPRNDFGSAFPDGASKGDSYVRIDQVPNIVYKYNGQKWIPVDKNLSGSYMFETAYLDYLIDALAQGQYDLDHLNESEREQIAKRLKDTRTAS